VEYEMTNLLARILLSIMLLPLAVIVYVAVLFSMVRPRDEVGFLAATLVTAVFVGLYWVALWRGSVQWTPSRVRRTVLSALGCAAVGIVAGFMAITVTHIHDESFGIFIGGLVAIPLWLVATILLWRETALERAERIRQSASDVLFCPRCGYNMTGLHMARCPECGAQYTLNQLFAAQRQEHEIADAASPMEERADR
jgi:hypothetical protein